VPTVVSFEFLMTNDRWSKTIASSGRAGRVSINNRQRCGEQEHHHVANMTRRHAIGLIAAAPALFSTAAKATARGVDETAFVRIGDIDQWIGIQGQDARNPVILYHHGGPAEAQSPFLNQFIPWETDFTVVN
jgi:hypothetical protein